MNHSQFADDTLLVGGSSQIMVSRFLVWLSLGRNYKQKQESNICMEYKN